MRLGTSVLVFASLLAATGSIAAGLNPPASTVISGPQQPAGPGVIRAVVVKSWGGGSGSLSWDYLNNNWSLYGSAPIFIDYTSLHAVPSFTLADLENSGADVVIVSDPAGGLLPWSAAEVAALSSYAGQGHALVGTYLILAYSNIDNRALAPLWGLRSDIGYNTADVTSATSAEILSPSSCLFTRISPPLVQGGYPHVQVPAADLSWDAPDLAGAAFLARSSDGRNVVTTYSNGVSQATFISYMPEYQDGSQFDATQYLYNAIACPFSPTPAAKASWGRLKALYR
jgi:hypothetical protein